MWVLMYVAGFVSATVLLIGISEWQRKKRRRKRAAEKQSGKSPEKKAGKRVKIDTYVKAATSIVLAHGLIMVTMSYVLAWFEKDAVVDVSTTLITEIVAPLCLYMGTNCIMNIFEKNKLSFSEPIQMQKVREVWNKVHEDMEDETGGNAAG